MAAHWGWGWRGASWDRLWPPAPAVVAAACEEKAGGSGTGCLVAMPTQGLCELGKLAGNTAAARASARPLGERAPPRAEGRVRHGVQPCTAPRRASGVGAVMMLDRVAEGPFGPSRPPSFTPIL